MKKTYVVALSTALVLGMAGAALATDVQPAAETSAVSAMGSSKITLDGSIRARGKISDSTHPDTDSAANYDLRVRLGVAAQVSDQASGYLQIENGEGTKDYEVWGESDLASLNNGGEKHGGLNILQAWINYTIGNGGVKVGHIPLALGNKLFFDHTGSADDAIIGYYTSGNLHMAGLIIKFTEDPGLGLGGTATNTDDIEGYVGLATYKVNDMANLGINLTNLRLNVTEMDFYNLGLTLDGKTGAISYGLDGEIQFGDIADNYDANGWAVMAKANMDLGAVNVGLLFGYGTGDDGTDATGSDDFVNFLTDTAYQSYMFGYVESTPAINRPANFDGNWKNSGLSNLTLYQLNASMNTVCPISGKDLSLMGRLNYGVATEVPSGLDDALGTELILNATWKLSNGLSYTVEAAYLWAGDAYDWWDSDGEVLVDADNAYFVRHGLELKF